MSSEAEAVARLEVTASDQLVQSRVEHSAFDEMDLRAKLRFNVRHAA